MFLTSVSLNDRKFMGDDNFLSLTVVKMLGEELTNQANLEIGLKILKQKQRKDQQVSVLQKKK